MKNILLAIGLLVGLHANAQDRIPGFPQLLNSIEHPVFASGNYEVSKHFTDKHNNVAHAYGQQTLKGLPIEGAYFDAHARNGRIISHHESFISAERLSAASHSLSKDAVLNSFLAQYAQYFGDATTAANWEKIGFEQYQLVDPSLSEEPIKMKKTYALHNGSLVPSWSMSCYFLDGSHWYYTVINATTGEEVEKIDWVTSCKIDHDHSAHAFASTNAQPSPTGGSSHKKADGATYNVFDKPTESPNHGNRVIVKDPADDEASPYGWHDEDGLTGPEYTITRGNNVLARDDRDGNNFGGYSPDGGENLNFDFAFDPSKSPSDNLDASLTNLFYWNNLMHDISYHYGFDEESGNFQSNNYGTNADGEGDLVVAEGLDGSGVNNSTFATPPDGNFGRMQMFLWGDTKGDDFSIESPSQNAGSQNAAPANFGGSLSAIPLKGEVVVVQDATTAPLEACEDIINPENVKGKIALISRGGCTFVTKVRNAQDAGAIAAIIYNNRNGNPFGMAGDGTEDDITIPAFMITEQLGESLAAEIANNTSINITAYDSTGYGGIDGDYDNGVIAHEYGHGISNRLTGGAENTNCLVGREQMGEGWSDFFALVLTHPKGSKGSDRRGIGTYVSDQPTTGGGIRPAPYTTVRTNSPYVYSNINNMQAPHGVGAVWCAMLWDLYWALIEEYGYDEDLIDGTGGNNICIQLVMDGMKLQPCRPSFDEARDAILLADEINNDGKNERAIWTAFTNRGLGFGAGVGNPSFDLPPKYKGFVSVEKTAVEEIDEDKTLKYTITLSNLSDKDYTDVEVTDTIPEILEFISASSDCNWTADGNVLKMTVPLIKSDETITCTYETKAKEGDYSKLFIENDAEADDEFWLPESEIGDVPWVVQSDIKATGEAAWFVDNTGTNGDQSLLFNAGLIGDDAVLSFQHAFSLGQGFAGQVGDGGAIEISEDGGTWFDAELYFIENGYNGEINSATSTLNGRAAFTGNSDGFMTSTIDLSKWANKEVIIKFRFAEDRFQGGIGWYVDDVTIRKLVEATNTVHTVNDGNASSSTANTIIYETVDGGGGGNSVGEAGNASFSKVFPNPSSLSTNILLNSDVVKAEMTLTDLNGRVMSSQILNGGFNQINTQNLAPGSYIISINNGGTIQRHQFIKN